MDLEDSEKISLCADWTKQQQSDAAVREKSVSRHHMGIQLRSPLKPVASSQHYLIEEYKGGPLIDPSLCREISLTADVSFLRCFF